MWEGRVQYDSGPILLSVVFFIPFVDVRCFLSVVDDVLVATCAQKPVVCA